MHATSARCAPGGLHIKGNIPLQLSVKLLFLLLSPKVSLACLVCQKVSVAFKPSLRVSLLIGRVGIVGLLGSF